ncbi:MAG: micrococcal nuclease [Patescibacteria group bacterium]|nr:micrococcal nuclease [Patescibacteria group bacterium]
MISRKKLLTLLISLAITAIAIQLERQDPVSTESPKQESGQVAAVNPRVTRVVDGDTFEVSIGDTVEKVRMLGIDTPESVDPRRPVQCFAKEATKKLKELIEGQEVVLTQDYSNDDRDKYGRMLRYVARMDGLLVNEEMIKEGYAYAYIKFPFERREAYLKLQTGARTMGRGLWATTTCSGRR